MRIQVFLSMLAVFFNMLMFTFPARAADWTVIGTERTPAHQGAGNALKLHLGAAELSNDLGASMLKAEGQSTGRTVMIPLADSMNGVNIGAAEGHSFIFAKFDPDNSTGTIFAFRIIRDTRGQLMQQIRQFTPADGAVFEKRLGTNPFADFSGPAGDPLFRQITQSAFFTAAGLFQQHIQGTYGLIATQSTRPVVTQKKSGNAFRKKITTTLTAYTKPNWVWILPALAEVQGLSTIAGYKTTDGVAVQTAAAFLPAGYGTDMPSNEYVSFQQQETKSSWTGLTMILVIIVLSAITAGTYAALSPTLFAGAGAFGGGATMSVGSAMGWGALGGAIGGAAGNLIANGGDWNLATTQGALVGGKTDIEAGASTGKWDYRPALHNGWQDKTGYSPSEVFKSPGAAGQYFGQALPTLKNQPAGSTLAGDAMAGDVDKPKETSLGVDLGGVDFQSGGLAVENPFGSPLGGTGLE